MDIGIFLNNMRTRMAGGDPGTGDMIISTSNLITLMEDLRDKQKSGISIQTMLQKVGEHFHNKQVASLFKILHTKMIGSGESLSKSMEKFPIAFPKYLVALISACEESGNWTSSSKNGQIEPGILDLLISLLKRTNKAKRKFIAGMIYPAVIIVVILAAVSIFSFTILPSIKEVFVALQVFNSMNFLSKGLFSFGEYFQTNYQYIPLLLLGTIGLIKLLWSFQLKKLWEHYQIRIKYINNLFINMFIAENFMLLGVLYNAGLTVVDCLTIIGKTCTNREIAGGFEEARNLIGTSGMELSKALKKSHFAFHEELIYRVSTAEETGTIDEAMIDYANQLFERLDEQIDTFIKMVEPAMILIGGFVVALLAISFYGSISSALANIR